MKKFVAVFVAAGTIAGGLSQILELWHSNNTCEDQLLSLSKVHVDQIVNYRMALHECKERKSCVSDSEKISH